MSNLKQYKQYDTDLFSVRDTIGVPHSYCIGAKHVGHASDNYHSLLGTDAIKSGERKGITCEVRNCQLTYEQHEIALAINCKSKDDKLLNSYLVSIIEQAEKDKYVGFVLIDCTNKGVKYE